MKYVYAVMNWDDELTVRTANTDVPMKRFVSGHTLFSETVEAEDPRLYDDLLVELYKYVENDIRKSYRKVGVKECKLDQLMRDVTGRKNIQRMQRS